MRGRKPKPAEQRALEGNPGHRALVLAPKTSIAESYPAPEWLSKRGREEWERIEPELRAIGVLTVADLPAFAGYCSAVGVARECEEQLAKATGSVKKKAFWIGSARKAWEEVRRWAVEFGLTPVGRMRLKATDPKKKEDPLDAFLGKRRTGADAG